MCTWRWLGPAAKLIAAIGPSHDRHLPTKKTSRVVHDHGIPDVRLYRGRTEVGAVHHLRNGPLPRAQGPVARWHSSAALLKIPMRRVIHVPGLKCWVVGWFAKAHYRRVHTLAPKSGMYNCLRF